MGENDFDGWLQRFPNAVPPVDERVRLATEICRRAEEGCGSLSDCTLTTTEAMSNLSVTNLSSSTPQQDLVSWQGVSTRWFSRVLMRTREMQAFLSYGCRMWFVRNHGITTMLRRRGVSSSQGGSIVDHVDKFEITPEDTNFEDSEHTEGGARESSIGPATCFISYTGEMTLAEFAELIAHPRLSYCQYLWMDVVCVCQFSWTERKDVEMMQLKTSFLRRVYDRIGSFGLTVLLVSRWDEVIATLGKIWVLWEIFSTVDGGATLDILLPRTEHQRFYEAFLRLKTEKVSPIDALSTVDSRKATSFVEADREIIMALMEQRDGIFNVNRKILHCLRSWMVCRAENMLPHASGRDPIHSRIRNSLSVLYEQLGEYSKAEEILREDLLICQETYGASHEQVLLRMLDLAYVLSHSDTEECLHEAETMTRNVLGLYQSRVGEHHRRTVLTKRLLSRILYTRCKEDDAERYRREAQSTEECNSPRESSQHDTVRERIFFEQLTPLESPQILGKQLTEVREERGPKHRDTIETMEKLAVSLLEEGKYGEAAALLDEASRSNAEQLGADKKETLESLFGYGFALIHSGNPSQAESVLRDAHRISIETFGEVHSQTLQIANQLSQALYNQGKVDEAEQLSLQCMDMAEKHFSNEPFQLLQTFTKRSVLLQDQDRYAEAVPVMRTLVECSRSYFGPTDQRTLVNVIDLGIFECRSGNVEEGTSILEEAMEAMGESLGWSHPETVSTQDLVAAVKKNKHALQ